MAAGKAIVVSESSAQCIEHLKDGFIVRDGNVVGFAEGINTLLNNTHLRQSLGNNAKKKVVTLFNWNTVAKQIEDIYNKVNLHN
jgi:glycosyltransferase involved in cell wall biosynthesis